MTGKRAKRSDRGLSLTSEERETIISHNGSDGGKINIYTSEQPMIRKLLNNPLFKVIDKRYNKSYTCHPKPVSVEGILPIKSLTIRKKIKKLTHKQRKKATATLKHAREARKH